MSQLSRWFPSPCLDCMRRAAWAISMALASHQAPDATGGSALLWARRYRYPLLVQPFQHSFKTSLRLSSEMRTCNKPSPSSRQKCALSVFETSGVALGLVEERLVIFNINLLCNTPGMTCVEKKSAIKTGEIRRDRTSQWKRLRTCCARISGGQGVGRGHLLFPDPSDRISSRDNIRKRTGWARSW